MSRGRWLLHDLSEAEQVAFVESCGTQFGRELEATAAWVLDQWAQHGAGLSFRLLPRRASPMRVGRAATVLALCLVSTRHAVLAWAEQDFQGDVELAVRAAIGQQLRHLGLSAVVGPHA